LRGNDGLDQSRAAGGSDKLPTPCWELSGTLVFKMDLVSFFVELNLFPVTSTIQLTLTSLDD
jgi:hypothetical protein